MRKIFWATVLLGAYLYLTGTGQQGLILEKGKQFYAYIVSWLQDANIDYHTQKPEKKNSRRWR